MSNDDEGDSQPPIKSQRHRYQSRAQRQRSMTPDNQLDERVHNSFEGSQGSLYERDVEKHMGSARSLSSSSCSGAENVTIGYRRAPQRSSGRSTDDHRIRRSR